MPLVSSLLWWSPVSTLHKTRHLSSENHNTVQDSSSRPSPSPTRSPEDQLVVTRHYNAIETSRALTPIQYLLTLDLDVLQMHRQFSACRHVNSVVYRRTHSYRYPLSSLKFNVMFTFGLLNKNIYFKQIVLSFLFL